MKRVSAFLLLCGPLVACIVDSAPQNGAQKCAATATRPCAGGFYCATDGFCWRTGSAPNSPNANLTPVVDAKDGEVDGACVADLVCGSDTYCEGAACVRKKPDGTRASSSDECESTYLVNGVCCSTPSCPGAICSSANEIRPASTCDAKGSCSTPAKQTCGGASICVSGACTTSCQTDSDCGPDRYCGNGSVCFSKKPNGSVVASATECLSTHLVDGVCCSTSSCPGAICPSGSSSFTPAATCNNASGVCSATDQRCSAPPNASALCSMGACGAAICDAGFGKCPDGSCRRECPNHVVLGMLVGSSGSVSYPTGIDASGDSIVGFQLVKFAQVGFVWRKGSPIAPLPPIESGTAPLASAIGSDGKTIVGSGKINGMLNPFGWTSSASFLLTDDRKATYEGRGVTPRATFFLLAGTDDAGTISTYLKSAGGNVAKVLDGEPLGMSDDARLLASIDVNGCLKTNGGTPPETPGVPCFLGAALSKDGRYIFGNGASTFSRWTVGGPAENLTAVGGASKTVVDDVSFDGKIVLGHAKVGSVNIPFLWREGKGAEKLLDALTSANIDLSAWSGMTFHKISGDGLVVAGSGTHGVGERDSFRIVLP